MSVVSKGPRLSVVSFASSRSPPRRSALRARKPNEFLAVCSLQYMCTYINYTMTVLTLTCIFPSRLHYRILNYTLTLIISAYT